MLVIAENLPSAAKFAARVFTDFRPHELLNGTLLNMGIGRGGFAVLAAGVIIMFIRETLTERGVNCRVLFTDMRPAAQFLCLFALFCALIAFGVYSGGAEGAAFIYGNY